MKVRIKTLTPVHIGTGKELSSTDFYNNYRISFDKLCDYIYEKEGDKFLDYLNDENNLNSLTITKLISEFKLNPNEVIKNCGIYRLNTSLTKNTREIFKTNNQLTIPGSSLKGAIRTALLYKVLKNKPEFVHQYLERIDLKINRAEAKNFDRIMKTMDEDLIVEAFHYGVKNNDGKVSYRDQQFDLLKLLYVSDSSGVTLDNNCDVNEIKVYALKKDKPHLGFSIFAECISPFTEFEFEIKFDVAFVKQLAKDFTNPKSKVGKEVFIDADKKLKNLFGIDIQNLNDIREEKIINKILSDLIDFGKKVSDIEKKFVDLLKSNNGFSKLNTLYSFDKKFKIGYGSGFHAMTIFPLLYFERGLKTKAEKIYRALRIGQHRNKQPMKIDEFPFTRKYNVSNQVDALGWVTLSDYFGQYQDLIKSSTVKIEQNSQNSQAKTSSSQNYIIAEIIDAKSKPPKVKILTGQYTGVETILPQVKLEGLGLKEGSKVYVTLLIQGKKVQKADFKGKAG